MSQQPDPTRERPGPRLSRSARMTRRMYRRLRRTLQTADRGFTP